MPLPDDTTVTVCSACQKASCWHYVYLCDDYRTAGTKQMTVGELRKLALEHEMYWDIDQATGVSRKP